MKRLLIALPIIFILTISVSACREPVGGFGGGGSGSGIELDFMWLVPARLIYETEQSFDKFNDLKILLAEEGVVKEISVTRSDVKIEILYFDAQIDEPEPIPVPNRFFEFTFPGRHAVKVTYMEGTESEKSAQYSVEVRGTATGTGDGSDFFDLIWM